MALRLRIKELLAERAKQEGRKISPNRLAEVIGVSPNTIRAYVEDRAVRPDLRILGRLQDYFECAVEDLFEYIEDEIDFDKLEEA